jgi:flagellar M-ring protein FliF
MDFLNKAYAQIADLFRSMTPGARITAGLLLVVVVVSLGYLFNGQMSGPTTDLMHGEPIPASEIPKMLGAFDKANLKGAKVEGSQIYVPHGQETAYMGALVANDALPANFGSVMQKAIESSNPFMSSEERKNRMMVAKAGLLGMIITKMPGMETGNVIFDVDTTTGLNRSKLLTATATAKLQGSAQLDEAMVFSIRQAVKGAIAGMKPEDVTVIDLNGGAWSGSAEQGGAGADEFTSRKRMHEKDLKDKILFALKNIPGVTVAASVQLDLNKKTRTTKLVHDKSKTVDVHSMESETSRNSDTVGTGGQPGFAAQQPNQAVTLGNRPSSGSKEEDTGKKTETTTIPSSEQTDIEKIGLTPIMERVTIGIPSGYFKKAWLLDNPPAVGQDAKDPDVAVLDQYKTKTIDKIRKQVAMLLTPPEGNTDPLQLVDVSDFPEIPAALPPEPSLAKNAMTWLGDYWSVAGLIGLAAMSLLMLRAMIKSAPPLIPNSMPRLADTPDEPGQASGEKKDAPRGRRFSTGPSLRDEICELVKEDPEIAANILKSWIGHAG